jgi:hypothetical protein
MRCDRVLRHSIYFRRRRPGRTHSISNFIFVCTVTAVFALYSMPGTFTPTPEQLALREARRLQKEKAATNATSPLVNNEKGQILSRPWLAVQDSHTNATLSTKIMTWNVRNFVFCSCVDR